MRKLALVVLLALPMIAGARGFGFAPSYNESSAVAGSVSVGVGSGVYSTQGQAGVDSYSNGGNTGVHTYSGVRGFSFGRNFSGSGAGAFGSAFQSQGFNFD